MVTYNYIFFYWQILQEISILFPFCKGDYQGWKDSIRHNLSSNGCFRKVLKDPLKPQAKDNYWTIDARPISFKATKLQNTVITRPTLMTCPYILHGRPYRPFNFQNSSFTRKYCSQRKSRGSVPSTNPQVYNPPQPSIVLNVWPPNVLAPPCCFTPNFSL
ncbi:forkhead activin signal transducer 3-like [Rana temporaria]|uniref:forkhead activin signal transducer 3-like n=1 Tax=Rana temporaria TaxID=8407 RepID=UPI001AAC9C88|nr:forkhead activin signal transducer 3-like [Rana temporaria]